MPAWCQGELALFGIICSAEGSEVRGLETEYVTRDPGAVDLGLAGHCSCSELRRPAFLIDSFS
jgi:hypothetical protein